MFWFITLATIVFLISLNALYVTAEFSAVSSRPSRLTKSAKEGNTIAATILDIVEDPRRLDAYIATSQVGITVSSLTLGFYGQSRLAGLISPYLDKLGDFSNLASQSISTTIILIVLSTFQVILGELVPKNIGMQFPERMVILTSLPMKWSALLFKPLIWLLNGSGELIMRLLGIDLEADHSNVHSPEEILILVRESERGGKLKRKEKELLENVIQTREALIGDVMIPKANILSAPDSLLPKQLLNIIVDSPYSRIPIYSGSINNILGVIHFRDLICFDKNNYQTIREIIHSVPFLSETMTVKEVFTLLQRKHFQVAIIIDQYGLTSGMVTLEDLLEQFFGDLSNEFDLSKDQTKK